MLPVFRTEAFVADVDRQINWYLAETDLEEKAIVLPQATSVKVFASRGQSIVVTG